MATHRQNLANKKNAARSTGPRTPSGKKASSANARRHGLFSGSVDHDPVQELLEAISGKPITIAQAALGDTAARLALSLAEAEAALRRVKLWHAEVEQALFRTLDPEAPAAIEAIDHRHLAQWRIGLRYRAEAESRRRKAMRSWLQYRSDVMMQETRA
jgi:hypothetical protein